MLEEGLGRLEFDPTGLITRASAGLAELLGAPTSDLGASADLVGVSLCALPGLPSDTWERLLAASSEAPVCDFAWRELADGGRACVRVELLREQDGGGTLRALDLTAALQGAPPVQLSPLSSALSHELRNPLSSVKMAVQTLARNEALSERDQRRLAIANREIRTLERMLWLLSEYARLGSARLEPLPLHALVEDAQQLVAAELAEREVQLVLDPGAAECSVKADRARTRVVLGQLLLSVALGTRGPHTLRLALHQQTATHTSVTLADRAARLSAGEAAQAFRPFSSTLSRGAGLALATLETVLRQQGGEATLVDHGEDGVTYLLHFPNAD